MTFGKLAVLLVCFVFLRRFLPASHDIRYSIELVESMKIPILAYVLYQIRNASRSTIVKITMVVGY